jgi:DNA-binding CsgD family transcriptional regulator
LALSGQPAAAYALLPPTSAAGDDAPGAIEARVVAAFVAGRPPDVLSIATRADLAAIGPADRRGLHALAISAIAAVDADDDVLAQRLIAELRRRPLGASDGGPLARWAQLTLTGRTGGAVEVARPLGLLAAASPPWTMVEQLVAAAASAAAREAADEVSALEVLASAEAAPTLAGRGPTDVVARLVRADAALMGLADAPSDDDLAEAARALGDAGVTGLAAAARAARGRLAAAQGHRDEAIAHLAAAAEDHLRSGRRRAASSVIGDLTGLGQAGRRAAAALGAAPLTAREREIACLAADGHTAQAIADRLVISRRTVETHLAHVYAKLAVSGRREMERRAEELGLRGS